MSKKKNRSVRTLPVHFISPRFPSPEQILEDYPSCKQSQDLRCFGDPVRKASDCFYYEQLYTRKSNDNIDSILDGVKNLSCKSSSSSLSWGDEFETECAKKIQNELELVERILCGEESVPSYYDEDEFKEWMETFPEMRILGTSIDQQIKNNASEQTMHNEEIYAIDPISDCSLEDCDKSTFETDTSHQEVIKTAVINTIYENVANRLLKKNAIGEKPREHNANKDKHKSLQKSSDTLTSIDIDQYLKISPIPQRRYFDITSNVPEPEASSRSLIDSQISSAKWLKVDSPEYTSLPFLTGDINGNNIQVVQQSDSDSRKRKYSTPKKTKKMLVLPPIESPNLVHNQFRSISAAPREHNKCLSAFSMKLGRELSNSRPRFDVLKYLSDKTTVKMRTSSRIPRIRKRWDSIDIE